MALDPARQTCPVPYPPEADRFGDALEAIMGDGTHDLAGIAEGLNRRGVAAGGRTVWTPDALSVYLAELAEA